MHNNNINKTNRFGRFTFAVLAALTFAAFLVFGEQPAVSQSAGYTTITDLGTLGGSSWATGINNNSQVVRHLEHFRTYHSPRLHLQRRPDV